MQVSDKDKIIMFDLFDEYFTSQMCEGSIIM